MAEFWNQLSLSFCLARSVYLSLSHLSVDSLSIRVLRYRSYQLQLRKNRSDRQDLINVTLAIIFPFWSTQM